MKKDFYSSVVKLLFFGNYFYGFCVIALSIETTLQLQIEIIDWPYYLLCFSLTVLYYSRAYLNIETAHDSNNLRAIWYHRNLKAIVASQWVFAALSVFFIAKMTLDYWSAIISFSFLEIFLLLIFPLVALLYYGINTKQFSSYKLRSIGWLKPLIIGFIWAGSVTAFPVLYHGLVHQSHFQPKLMALLLFLKNFMFVTVLSIMFDIKDYAKDYNKELKTVVVKMGLRRTIFLVIFPLILLGLGSFILYGIYRDFNWIKILLNTLPFILTLFVAFRLKERQSIFFYLIIIDGLMLFKAFCGIIAMVYF